MYRSGATLTAIAREFDCTPSAISYIVRKAEAAGAREDQETGAETAATVEAPAQPAPARETAAPAEEAPHQPRLEMPLQEARPERPQGDRPQRAERAAERTAERAEGQDRSQERPAERVNGERPYGDRQQGDRPRDRQQGEARFQGPRQGGERQGGERQGGDQRRTMQLQGRDRNQGRNQGERPERGDRQQGRNSAERNQGERNQGERNQGDRTQAPRGFADRGQVETFDPDVQIGEFIDRERPYPYHRQQRNAARIEAQETPSEPADTRMATAAQTCAELYRTWKANPADAGIQGLDDALHELRRVIARMEIEMSASRREEQRPIPIPSYRTNQQPPQQPRG
ncbi:hypothetical protein [Rhodospirillum centenum]|uniref:hypothetical protein n=1 Tax=Rhodospirillum centenum TaxID=34018 RepID=UPI000301B6FD|nr:hypothetical protein [Rhodospirillum centenum]